MTILEWSMVSKVKGFRFLETSLCKFPPKGWFYDLWKNDSSFDSKVWIFPNTTVLDLSETPMYEFIAIMELSMVSKVKGFSFLETSLCKFPPKIEFMIFGKTEPTKYSWAKKRARSCQNSACPRVRLPTGASANGLVQKIQTLAQRLPGLPA